ncbi:hypothetical protein Tco_1533957 [Tanacetum coccineum]
MEEINEVQDKGYIGGHYFGSHFVMSDSEDSTVTYTEAPPSPDYVPDPEYPPSLVYVPYSTEQSTRVMPPSRHDMLPSVESYCCDCLVIDVDRMMMMILRRRGKEEEKEHPALTVSDPTNQYTVLRIRCLSEISPPTTILLSSPLLVSLHTIASPTYHLGYRDALMKICLEIPWGKTFT